MKKVNFKKEVTGKFEDVISRLTEELKKDGFGVLTRIDFHSKMKEKLGKDLPPLAILGICNPKLAFDAFTADSDVTSLLPCNAVVRQLDTNRMSVELALPSTLLTLLNAKELVTAAEGADRALQGTLERL